MGEASDARQQSVENGSNTNRKTMQDRERRRDAAHEGAKAAAA